MNTEYIPNELDGTYISDEDEIGTQNNEESEDDE